MMYNMWRASGEEALPADHFVPKKPLTEEEIERRAVAFFEGLSNASQAEAKTKRQPR